MLEGEVIFQLLRDIKEKLQRDKKKDEDQRIIWVNLTKHEIKIITKTGETKTIPPSGLVLRVQEEEREVGEIEGISIVRREEKVQLPPEIKGVYYIVSGKVLDSLEKQGIKRSDILAPNTEAAIREGGRVKAVKSLKGLK